ncbi:MAG TPA: DUF5719 family protein [Acidimicrobiia bacterium]
MKRAAAVVTIGLLAVVAWTAPTPPSPEVTTTVTTTIPEPATAAAFAGCPWAIATDVEDSYFGLVTANRADVLLSFPFSGEVRTSVEDLLPGPGATSIRLGQYLAQGLAPATVEFTDSPAASAVLTAGLSSLSGTVCPSSTPKVWQLPAGSTKAGEQLTLQLFNPFPEDAIVRVGAYSEFGPEPASDLDGVGVQSRSWKTIELHTELPVRESLGLTVEVAQGNVIPALVHRPAEGVEATWTGTGKSEVWEFPLVGLGELDGELVIANEGPDQVPYEVDVISEEGTSFGVITGQVAPLAQVRIPLVDLAEGPFGVRVRAEGAVSAVATARGEGGYAVLPGAATTAQQWLLPGFGAEPEASYRIWLLNPGTDGLTVTLSPLSPEGLSGAPQKVSVPGETIRFRQLESFQVFGVIVEASGPFSVAWSAVKEGDVAFVEGVPVRVENAR